MGLLLVFLFGAMGISFLCSVLESVLMTTSLSYINLREEEGYAPAKLMSSYKEDTGRPLAAILSLNTIANTIGAAGVGMQATEVFGNKWFGLVSAVITLLILIFGEIIPKVIGTTYWRNLMGFTARTIQALIVILYPFVLLVELITRMFPDNEDEPSVSREEVLSMVNVGEEEGVVDEDENKIFSNLMRLDSIHAYDVMTPRVVAKIAPENMTLRAYYDNDEFIGFTNCIIYKDLCYLFFLAVDDNKRHQGYGSKILSIIKETYKDKVILLCFEEVDDSYEDNSNRIKRREFYYKNGFKDHPLKTIEYGVRYDTVYIGSHTISFEDYRKMYISQFGDFVKKIVKKG